jgi:outer membrane protein assembly factor BamB
MLPSQATYRANPARTGVFSTRALRDFSHVLWRRDTHMGTLTSPILWQDQLFVGGSANHVVALDAKSGVEHWVFPTQSAVYCAPTVTEDTLSFCTLNGIVHAVDLTTHRQRWQASIGRWTASTVAADGSLFCLGDRVYALDLATSEDRWPKTASGTPLPPRDPGEAPAADAHRVFLGDTDPTVGASGLYAYRLPTLELDWEKPGFLLQEDAPALTPARIYLPANSSLYALNASTGEDLWRFDAPRYTAVQGDESAYDEVAGACAVWRDQVYCGTILGLVYALDAATDAVRWRFRTRNGGHTLDAGVHAAPVVCEGVVYVCSSDGDVYALEAETGALLWQFSTGGTIRSVPWVQDAVVYVATIEGTLFALA